MPTLVTPPPVRRRNTPTSDERSSATKASLKKGARKLSMKSSVKKPKLKTKGKGKGRGNNTRLRGKQPDPRVPGGQADVVSKALNRASTADQLRTPDLSKLAGQKKEKKEKKLKNAAKAALAPSPAMQVATGLPGPGESSSSDAESEEVGKASKKESRRKDKAFARKRASFYRSLKSWKLNHQTS